MLLRRERGPTHEDALLAQREQMRRALIRIAYWSPDEEAARIAQEGLRAASEAYRAGVYRAVD